MFIAFSPHARVKEKPEDWFHYTSPTRQCDVENGKTGWQLLQTGGIATHAAVPAAPESDEMSKVTLKSALPISRLPYHHPPAAWTGVISG
jgi:hypothetical protein